MEPRDVERAVELAGLALPADLDWTIDGDGPVYKSPPHLGVGAAVARRLTGAGADAVWRARGGRPQAVRVDVRHAGAALLSFAHLRMADPAKQPSMELRAGAAVRLVRIVPARDGRHVQLHAAFADPDTILDELGLPSEATAEDIDAAVVERDAFELEDAFIRRRVCGGVVRTRAEWAEHPQGLALAGLPVVTITRIGDAPVEELPPADRPLAGVRVLDLTRVLAGPTAAKTLAEHGADVLHVSAPGLERGGPFEVETGIGKRQAAVDLREPGQDQVLRGLLRGADVFVQGYRLGALGRRGFGPEQAAEVRPGIVYVSENCYGHVGPWADRPGWEQLAQAATGMSHREGAASSAGIPRLAPAAVNDYTTGWFAAYGALMALARRATEGGSWLVQTSLSQTAMWYQRLGDDADREAADPGDVTPFLAEMDTPHHGRMRYLAPALSMSDTPPRWDLPPAPMGTHEPVWSA
jgi:crotonobetainyl-CoA:carnitine CoA-transferase CaiB-like acyl-CoA transferase